MSTNSTAEPGPTTQYITNGILGILVFSLNALSLISILLSRSFPARQKVLFFSLLLTDTLLGFQILCVRLIPIRYNSEHFLCKSRLYTGIIFTYSTILSNLFITIERLFSISLPVNINRQITWKKMAIVVALIWTIAIILTFSFFATDFEGPVCQFVVVGNLTGYVVLGFSICIVFLIIVVMYAYIAKVTRRHIRQIAATMVGNNPVTNIGIVYQNKADLRTTVTVGIIVGIFGISYCPMGVYLIYSGLYVSDVTAFIATNQTIFTIMLTFYVMNSLINPIVYIFRLKKCRQEMIARILCRPQPDFLNPNHVT
ncbi:hypothetical protein SNE40_023393 [Patella caerulea]|uniref:G-protein coupled receptors family 1 profile domain-containing protein n=1 Tax=Patella caerulea TaxID=87958 RepID=A0AAN8G342_PATCE